MRRSAAATMLATALVAGAAAAAEADPPVVPWTEAEKHVGKAVVVEGRVLGKHCSPTSCLLAFEPTFDKFTAVVQAKDFKVLPPETIEAKFVGRTVRVKGTVRMLERKPEIVITRPDDIQAVVTPRERAEERAAVQDEMTQRMTDILERLEDLLGRVEATQARLEQVAIALGEQTAQLAALQAAQSEPLPEEPYAGEPPPRPGFERLRTIKRGMTSDQVARLLGPPTTSESEVGGGYIWYYGVGRSVSFDRRNRAVALVGF